MNIIDKLKELYPTFKNGYYFVGGRAKAIVSCLGLTTECFVRFDGKKQQVRYIENEKIPIIKFTDKTITIHNDLGEVDLLPFHFKGIEYKK